MFLKYLRGAFIPAFATDETRSRHQEERGGHQEEDSEASKDADDLSPVHDHGQSGVTQLALAVTRVIVAEQEVILNRSCLYHLC